MPAPLTPLPPHLFCFGYGYVSDHLARSLKAEGSWTISGTTRDLDKRDAMQDTGVDAYVFAPDKPLGDARAFMHDVTHVLISTPPDDAGDPTFLHHGEELARMKSLQWVGYLSSTSVYGDRDGGWVDEESELRPNSKRGSRRLLAEEQWLSAYQGPGLPVHIFRLAGIYGPGRSALDSVRAGNSRRIDKPGHAFSRIHIDDIVQILRASMAAPKPGRIYNLADDEAAPSQKLIALACEMLGLPVPPLIPFDQVDMAPMARSFYADNKRVRNDRVKEELGITLKYPDFRSGLAACLAADPQDGLAPRFFGEANSG